MARELLTTNDIMAIYKVSRATVDRWRKRGLPSIKIGNSVRFEENEVQKWIKENSNKR